MLRLCSLTVASRRTCCVTVSAASNPLCLCARDYATGHHGTRSSVKERRYYTDPLRAPQSGVRTVVGRFTHQSTTSPVAATDGTTRAVNPAHAASDATTTKMAAAAADSTSTAAAVDTTTRCVTTRASYPNQLMALLTAHGRTVRYDSEGVPIEGSWYLLPWPEQMRILAAVVGALCITKAFFDVVRFELLYYGVWKLGYRNDDSLMKRVLYYGSTAMLAAGLLFSFNLNFFLSAWVVGRREIAAHMVCNGFAHVMPHRAVQLIERRLKLSLV